MNYHEIIWQGKYRVEMGKERLSQIQYTSRVLVDSNIMDKVVNNIEEFYQKTSGFFVFYKLNKELFFEVDLTFKVGDIVVVDDDPFIIVAICSNTSCRVLKARHGGEEALDITNASHIGKAGILTWLQR